MIPVGGFAESWSVSPSSIPADAGANAMILAASPYDLILPPFAADSFGVAVSYQPSQRWTATSIPFSFTSRPVTATATLTNVWGDSGQLTFLGTLDGVFAPHRFVDIAWANDGRQSLRLTHPDGSGTTYAIQLLPNPLSPYEEGGYFGGEVSREITSITTPEPCSLLLAALAVLLALAAQGPRHRCRLGMASRSVSIIGGLSLLMLHRPAAGFQ